MPFHHAVVLGGSIAGLLAAAGLSDSFDQVTIVDRDELLLDGPEARTSRKGVPHGDQIHHMLALGSERIDALLPGLDDELLDHGCRRYDPLADFAQYVSGKWIVRVRTDLRITCFPRPLLEWVMRRRVLALDNVAARRGVVRGLVGTPDGRQVRGVAVEGSPEPLLADLVVDATGRLSGAPGWLAELGYDVPDEAQQRIHMGYSTFVIEFPDGVLPDGLAGVTSTGGGAAFKGAAIRPHADGLHMVMAGGLMKNYPPRDLDGLRDYVEGLDSPYIAQFLAQGKVIGDVKSFRLAANHRRYWERLERRPEGFVLVGDAVSYFNPMYGQGMTTASLGAHVLRDAVVAADGEIGGLATAVQQGIAPWVDIAFDNAVRIDSANEGCEYVNLEAPQRNVELERAIVDLQTEDAEVAIAVRRAMLFMDNSFLATESIQRKIADWISSGRTVRPEAADPLALPEVTG